MLHSPSSKCSEVIKQGDSAETCPQPPSQQVTRRTKAPGSTLYSPSILLPKSGCRQTWGLGPQSRSSWEQGRHPRAQGLGTHTNHLRDNLEFVSPLLDSCLLKTLRWEQIEDTFTSQETQLDDCSVHSCHVGVLARKMPKRWGKRSWGRESDISKLSIQI